MESSVSACFPKRWLFAMRTCSISRSMFSFRVSSCPCIIRTMVISSSRLQLFSSSSVCLSAIVPLLKLFLLYQKTQRIANRQPPQVSSFCLCLYGGVMVIEPGKYKVFKVLKFYPDSPVDTSQTMKQRPERL